MTILKWKLYWQILAALVLALVFGLVAQASGGDVESGWVSVVVGVASFVGKLFLNALKMIVLPLIVSSIVVGILGIGGEKGFGRLGLKTLFCFGTAGFSGA
ncbi:hypothetical protein VDG1235_1389 [Verrucomicrobiia bacterium DG1235]|nr:hypothetical protein VDG1235_1389 [Verrucomicrobiae bacterium DG1235]